MKTISAGLIALASLALLATGCATQEQWSEWRAHSSHFASGQHAAFSFRNPGPEATDLKRTDLETASAETWWGRRLPVHRASDTERLPAASPPTSPSDSGGTAAPSR